MEYQMSVMNTTCPGCGITLEADRKYLGTKVMCTECEYKFTLWRPEELLPHYPDMLEEVKSKIVARAGLPLSFQSPLFTHEQLAMALSEEDTKRIFHFSYPLLRPYEEDVYIDGNRRYWAAPIVIQGESYLICKEWFDYNRKFLIFWFRQMAVDYDDLKETCNTLVQTYIIPAEEEGDHIPNFNECMHTLTPVTINQGNQFKSGPFLSQETFTKRVDWSSLTTGITIPVKSHEAFLKHVEANLQPGDSHPVFLSVQGKKFRVSINNIAFAAPNHSRCLMFLWSRKSPIALMLQATFSEVFAQLRENHTDKHGITDILTVSCSDQLDHFVVELSKAMVIPDTLSEVEYPETVVPAESVSLEFQQFADKCGELLEEFFARGFRLNSPIANKRFHSFWKEKYMEECDFDDNDIQKAMKLIGVEFEKRIYAPRQLASQEIFDEIKRYVENLFAEGKTFIYYQALFDEFIRRGTDWKINSPEMLKSFLAANECPYSLRRSCIAIDRDVAIFPISEIRDYLREQQEPVGYDKLQEALPHFPLNIIKHELTTNTEFVNTAPREYIHADIVDLSESDLEVIADMIRTEIHSKRYMTGTELWEKLETEFPKYTDRYSHLPLIGFRDALKHKFFGQFNFQGNIISSVDDPIRMADIFAGFCKRRNSFTLADLERLRADVDAPVIYFEPVYENSVRISQDDFVSPESISFDIDAIDEALERFCSGEFIAIADITSFAAFPSMEVQWTSYLVEAFVAKYSKKFKLLHNQYNATVCAGAILRADAKLYDYSQVLTIALAKANCELDSATALDYLCNAGFLGRRRYTNIAIVLSEARQIRSRKR